MVAGRYDVVGLGNAIVDVIANVDDGFLEAHGLHKATMQLVGSEEASSLYDAMPPSIESSGGSAANTMAGVASFGGRAAFIGKVRDDQLGEVFRHDLRAAGVDFEVAPAVEGPPTGRCLVQVTPDAQRTMSTSLGIAGLLAPDDLDGDLLGAAGIIYCEGYLWDVDIAKAAICRAMDVGRVRGAKVALTLSDPFCVERHRDEWRVLIEERVDILFANEIELLAMYGGSFDDTAREAARRVEIACCTRSERGSRIVAGDQVVDIPAAPVDELVDTTGAGDLYAAGFLYGLSQGFDLRTCGELAALAAAEVISHVGARPQVALADLAAPVLSRPAG